MIGESQEIYDLLNALENESNASIIKLNTSKIKEQKNNILQKLQLDRDILKSFHKKLKEYRYCSDMADLQYGYYIRWISLKNPSKIILTNGGHITDLDITERGITITVKNNKNRFFKIRLDDVLIFQKISLQEKVILKVLDLLDKN
tara:strand:- start:256 stop:693 length:438 start_codon:yes stop_codon:yes gene_type:complete